MNKLEEQVGQIASLVAPWLTPLVLVYIIFQALQGDPFFWNRIMAGLTGVIVEINGVALASTALMLWAWNKNTPKRAEKAPTWAAIAGLLIYYATVLLLAMALEVWPEKWSVAVYVLFVLLSASSANNWALRVDHRRRVREHHGQHAQAQRTTASKREEALPAPRTRLLPANKPVGYDDLFSNVREQFGGLTVSVHDVREQLNIGRTKATQLLGYAIQVGDATRIGRGRYQIREI